MKTNAFNHICCPKCFGDLNKIVIKQDDNEIINGQAVCAVCNQIYPIENGVVRMVDYDLLDPRQLQTMDVFSTQWRNFGDITIDEKAFVISRQWLFSRYGWGDDNGVAAYLVDKDMILDAGSATGRYANFFAKVSGKTVFGAEISDGVDVAFSHFHETPNVHYIQASITELPFRPGTFNFIMCDGVLHHTTDPRENFRKLITLLCKGGEVAIYLYHIGNPLREMTDDFLIDALSKRSMAENLRISRRMTELAEELYNSGARVVIPDRLEKLDIEAGEHSLYELMLYKVFKLHWDPNVSFEKNWSTNFDWFAPVNAYRYTGDEILIWFKEEGLIILHQDISQRGISIRGRKC